MPGTSTQFKLGLFSLTALAAVVATAVGLGVRGSRDDMVRYETYFDESAQGLEVGSPVKYRGVRIGNVSDIAIAPDRKQVSVGLALERSAVVRLGLEQVSPVLRSQLALQGITGVKFIDIDFVDAAAHPPPVLAFLPGRNYIPSRPSLFKGLEARLGGVVRGVPALIDSSTAALEKVSRLLDDVHDRQLAARLGKLVETLDAAAHDLHGWVGQLERARLPQRAAATLERVDALADKLDVSLDQLDGTRGLIASATRATDSLGEVGRSARGSSKELERTLRDLGEAARAVRDFLDTLEREPDMLVKGKARTR
jgi:phospholipid/cholesterol/gamma-HCH transport system substrate-binding protein